MGGVAGLWLGLDPQLSGQGTPRSLRPPQTQPPSPASSGNFPPGPRGRRQDQEGRAGAHPTFLAGCAAPPASQLSLRPWARPGPRWAPRGSDSQRMRAPSVSGCVVVSAVTRPPPGATSPVPGEPSQGRVVSPVAPAPAVPARCHLMRPGRGARGGEACFRRAGGGGGLQSFLAPQAPRLPCPRDFSPSGDAHTHLPGSRGRGLGRGRPDPGARPAPPPAAAVPRPATPGHQQAPGASSDPPVLSSLPSQAGSRCQAAGLGGAPRSSPPQVRVATAGSRAPGVADGTQFSAATESGPVTSPL